MEIPHYGGKTNLCLCEFYQRRLQGTPLGVHGAHLIKYYLKYRREVIKHYRRKSKKFLISPTQQIQSPFEI